MPIYCLTWLCIGLYGYGRIFHSSMQRPSPTLDSSNKKWSADIIDFLSKCLNKNPEARSSAEELLQHPFIAKYKKSKVMKALVEDCRKKQKKAGRALEQQVAPRVPIVSSTAIHKLSPESSGSFTHSEKEDSREEQVVT